MTKKALITGVSGQDGSYLAEFLLQKGYEVHGTLRRHSVSENQTARIDHLRGKDNFHLHYSDLTDMSSINNILNLVEFDEIYNLAAQSHVGVSFEMPIYTNQVNYMGFINLLEAVKSKPYAKKVKIYQASSSEMFGNIVDSDGFQREITPMNPVSPYGVSKLASYQIARNYRRAYGIWISNGILFNHESYRRGSNFVTAKVCKAVARIRFGFQDKLELGHLDSSRDWGHASDYIRAMWSILNEASSPDDYVCATGQTKSIKELCEVAFGFLGMDWEKYVVSVEKFKRAEDLKYLKGDMTKLKNEIGFELKHTFETMIQEMVTYWLDYYESK